jgi:hypothetical protein
MARRVQGHEEYVVVVSLHSARLAFRFSGHELCGYLMALLDGGRLMFATLGSTRFECRSKRNA